MTKLAVLVSGTLEAMSPGADPELDADRVLEVLEDDFAGVAIGPAVGCDLLTGRIDVRYSVEGQSSAELHALISKISGRIDEAVEGRVLTATTPADQLEQACA